MTCPQQSMKTLILLHLFLLAEPCLPFSIKLPFHMCYMCQFFLQLLPGREIVLLHHLLDGVLVFLVVETVPQFDALAHSAFR